MIVTQSDNGPVVTVEDLLKAIQSLKRRYCPEDFDEGYNEGLGDLREVVEKGLDNLINQA